MTNSVFSRWPRLFCQPAGCLLLREGSGSFRLLGLIIRVGERNVKAVRPVFRIATVKKNSRKGKARREGPSENAKPNESQSARPNESQCKSQTGEGQCDAKQGRANARPSESQCKAAGGKRRPRARISYSQFISAPPTPPNPHKTHIPITRTPEKPNCPATARALSTAGARRLPSSPKAPGRPSAE